MKYLKKSILFFIICLFVTDCSSTQKIQVEYPVFENNKEGRQLAKFLGNTKIIAIKVEKSEKLQFDHSVSSFLDQIPDIVFAEFSKESYYQLIDINKRTDLINETTFSLTGVTQNQLELGKQLGAEGFLYIAFGVFNDLITLDASLVKVETGEIKKSTIIQQFDSQNDFVKSLRKAAKNISMTLSPRVKTVNIKIFVKYPQNIEIQTLLEEAQEEIKGETPNYKKAFELWNQANKKSRERSWQILTNMGTFYYVQGDFKNAVKYYEKAMKTPKIKSSEKAYIRNLRKKAESSMKHN